MESTGQKRSRDGEINSWSCEAAIRAPQAWRQTSRTDNAAHVHAARVYAQLAYQSAQLLFSLNPPR